MQIRAFIVIMAFAALAAMPARAYIPYYDFAFSIDDTNGTPVVTGEILGLEDNATTAPFDIVINSDPNNPAVGSGGYSLKANTFFASPYVDDRFTVANGILTGTGPGNSDLGAGLTWYKVFDVDPYSQIFYNFNAFGSSNGEGTSGTDVASTFYGNDDGPTGITYEPGTLSGLPEPSQWGEGIFFAVAFGFAWRRFVRSSPRVA